MKRVYENVKGFDRDQDLEKYFSDVLESEKKYNEICIRYKNDSEYRETLNQIWDRLKVENEQQTHLQNWNNEKNFKKTGGLP